MTDLDPTAIGTLGLLIPIVILLIVILYIVPIPLWIAAWSSGAYVGLPTLVGMRLRRVPPATVVNARISAVKAGLQISIDDLEASLFGWRKRRAGCQCAHLSRQGKY